MLPLIALIAAFSPVGGVSNHYTLWLSDTSVGVQADHGAIVGMHFPTNHPELSRDGTCAKYRDVFPGIDLTVYRNRADFEYDWIVAPGADPAAISLTFTGMQYERIESNGDLILGTAEGRVRHGRPFAYQEVGGVKRQIPAASHLASDGHVQFRLGGYDKTRTLIVDPALSFASGIGGSGFINYFLHPNFESDLGISMALDGAGNIYIAGLAYSPDFPLVNPLPLSILLNCAQTGCSCPSPFVAKLSPDGKTILYSTLLAITCNITSAPSLAVDRSGNVYVAGLLQNGFPFVQVGGGTVTANGPSDAFVAKLDTNGVLKAALTFGGSGADGATSISVGADGKLYVTGTTGSQDFPVTASALKTTLSSAQDLFLIKLDPTLLVGNQPPANAVLYSTYLGPGSSPVVAADAAGNAYIGASTTSTAWNATPGVFQSQCWDAARTSCADVIVLKINPTGSQFAYATYLGGSGTDTIGGMALDGSGAVYLTGATNSFDFPTTANAYQAPATGTWSLAFAVKLSADAAHLIYGTLLAPPSESVGTMTGSAIAVDSSGNAWVGGYTNVPSLPVQLGIQQTLFNSVCGFYTPSGGTPTSQGYCPQAGYLAELNASGSSLLWATYLGGGNVSAAYPSFTLPAPALNSIVFDSAGNVLVTGNQLAMLSTAASPATTNSASVVKIAPGAASIGHVTVQTAAGFGPGLPAPGGLAALYATGIPSTQMSGVTISVNGVAAPIVSVTSLAAPANTTQVNFQVPFEIPNAAQAQSYIVEVQSPGQSAFVVPQQAAPGIFTLPDGAGAIQHAADYSLVTVQNPAKRGETLIIYATGLGTVATPVASGVGAAGADPVRECNRGVLTNAGTVLYAGLAPGYPGLYQVNVQVSQYLPPGTNYFYLQAPGCWFGIEPPPDVYQGNSVGVYVP